MYLLLPFSFSNFEITLNTINDKRLFNPNTSIFTGCKGCKNPTWIKKCFQQECNVIHSGFNESFDIVLPTIKPYQNDLVKDFN